MDSKVKSSAVVAKANWCGVGSNCRELARVASDSSELAFRSALHSRLTRFAGLDVLCDSGIGTTGVLNDAGIAEGSPPRVAMSFRNCSFSSMSCACPATRLWYELSISASFSFLFWRLRLADSPFRFLRSAILSSTQGGVETLESVCDEQQPPS